MMGVDVRVCKGYWVVLPQRVILLLWKLLESGRCVKCGNRVKSLLRIAGTTNSGLQMVGIFFWQDVFQERPDMLSLPVFLLPQMILEILK